MISHNILMFCLRLKNRCSPTCVRKIDCERLIKNWFPSMLCAAVCTARPKVVVVRSLFLIHSLVGVILPFIHSLAFTQHKGTDVFQKCPSHLTLSDKNQTPYCGPTHIRRHHTKLTGELTSGICAPLIHQQYFAISSSRIESLRLLLKLWQSLTEISTRNLSWGVKVAGA
jgi:hypothetical protein